MGVAPGGNVHVKESVYELHKRGSHDFSPSVSHRLDHEVSLQGAGRRVAGADTNDYPAAVQRTWRPDRLRRFVARTCPYVAGNPAASAGMKRSPCTRAGTMALLEQKTKALDQAAPLDDWRLADCVHRLRRLMGGFRVGP